MSRKALLMLVLTVVGIALYATRWVPSIGISPNVSDFFGGMAVGLFIGFAFTWIAERP